MQQLIKSSQWALFLLYSKLKEALVGTSTSYVSTFITTLHTFC